MNINEDLLDRAVDSSVDFTRYNNGVVRRIIALLNRVDKDLFEQLTAALDRLPAESFTVDRLDALLQSVRRLNESAYTALQSELQVELKDLVAFESGYQLSLFKNVLPVQVVVAAVNVEQVYGAALSRPFSGRLLSEWSKSLEADKMTRIRDALRMGYVENQTVVQTVQRLRGTRAKGYSDGLIEIDRRNCAAVVRTATAHTANFTRQRFYEANESLIKGLKWVSTLDSRTSPVCRARDGEMYPVSSGPRPPAHWNCLPGDALITACGNVSGVSKRWVDADLVVIKTASGNKLSCTPNHPILTDSGWVAAKLLNKGDKIACGAVTKREGLREWDDDNVVPTIHDVTESFLQSRQVIPAPVPVSPEDFHGDGADSHVAVVWSDSFLAGGFDTVGTKETEECILVNGRPDVTSMFSGGSHEAQFLHASDATSNGVECMRRDCSSLSGAGSGHSCELLFRPVSSGDTVFGKNDIDGSYANSGPFEHTSDSDSRCEHVAHVLFGDTSGDNGFSNRRIGSRECSDTVGFKDSSDNLVGYSELAGDLLDGKHGVVTLDDLVSITVEQFSGHVYNLETVDGFYVANNIITHNCRSTMSPVTRSWREMGIDLDDLPESTRASISGQVPESMTYQDWLRKQSASRQDDILGKSKGLLFRKGELPLDRFVDRAGKELNLTQLREKHAEAFMKAGL